MLSADRRRIVPAAGLALVIAVSACTPAAPSHVTAAASDSPVASPSPTIAVPPSSTPPARPSPTRSTPAHTATPTHTRPPATSHPKPDQAPRIGAITLSPNDFGACAKPPVRPVVTAKVTDADDPPSALRVKVGYYLTQHYQGEVLMHYDAGRGLFVVQLPAVEASVAADFPGISGGHLSASVAVTDPAGNAPRPQMSGMVSTVEGCG